MSNSVCAARSFDFGREGEGNLRPDQALSQAIIRTCTYHRNGHDRDIIHFRPHEHVKVANSLSSILRDNPKKSLGNLDKLPYELLNMILGEHLDLGSLFRFRRVNLRARAIVYSLPGYELAFTYALDCMCALLRTRLARYISLAELYSLLRERVCSICGINYGEVVHLLAWRRVCFSCWDGREFNALLIAPGSKFEAAFGYFDEVLNRVPIMCLPWGYMVSVQAALEFYRDLLLKKGRAAYTRNQALNTRRIQEGLASLVGGCRDEMDWDPVVQRNLGLVSVMIPSYDSVTGWVEHGVCCSGCFDLLRTERQCKTCKLSSMTYSHEGFLQHFKQCKKAQELWKSSENGTVKPRNLHFNCEIRSPFNGRYQVPQYA